MNIEKELEKVNTQLEHIERLLMGNGKIGVAEMSRRAFDYMQNQTGSRQGLIDWVFRVIILIILGYVATKVGLQ